VTQYHIQGLELDYTIVCWDADLRREDNQWASHRIHGSGWQRHDSFIVPRKNTYRVLLTRARKGMMIFVPKGDESGFDETRNVDFYNGIYDHLLDCGANPY